MSSSSVKHVLYRFLLAMLGGVMIFATCGMSFSFVQLISESPAYLSNNHTSEEPTYLQAFVALSEDCVTYDWQSLKIDFYSATGVFRFLNSGDCWCPNRLLTHHCDALAIP